MTRRMFPAAVAALVGLFRARPAKLVTLKPGETIRTPWIDLRPRTIADPRVPRDRIYIVGINDWLPDGVQR